MKTFTQKLAETRNVMAIEELYALMSSIGVRPEKFNEWLLERSLSGMGDLHGEAAKWIDGEIRIVEQGFWQDVKTGAGYGAGIGMLGGPIGALKGAAAGGLVGAAKNLWSRFGGGQQQQQQAPASGVSIDDAINDLKAKLAGSPELSALMSDPRLKNAVEGMTSQLKNKLTQIATQAKPSPSPVPDAGAKPQPQTKPQPQPQAQTKVDPMAALTGGQVDKYQDPMGRLTQWQDKRRMGLEHKKRKGKLVSESRAEDQRFLDSITGKGRKGNWLSF